MAARDELVRSSIDSVSACQGGERLPAGTSAVRLSLAAFTGSRVSVKVLSGGRVVTGGERGAGWSGHTVTVPVRALSRALAPVRMCFRTGPFHDELILYGQRTAPGVAARTSGGEPLPGRVAVAYLGAPRGSWLSLASTVAQHMGLGRGWSGSWVAPLVALLMLAAVALASRLILREAPRAAWACALIAFLSAAAWSFITPAFQVPDEPDHFAYVKQLAETGDKPLTGVEDTYASEELFALQALRYAEVRQDPSVPATITQAQQARLQQGLEAFKRDPERGSPNAGSALHEPPLYYALQAIPYDLASSGTLLDRLQLMRLLSALMAGVTALFTYLFLREALPGGRWAWTVGALGVALCPLLGFMSGSVNPDAMLYAVCAALFYCVARGFRRGLTMRSGIATGAVIAMGLSTKVNFAGLLPGALLGLAVIGWRAARREGPRALPPAALAAAIGLLPVAGFLISNLRAGQPAIGTMGQQILHPHGSLLAEASFAWQLYLPPLPGMTGDLTGIAPALQLWFEGYIGRFGWLDTFFPGWAYTLALTLALLIAALAARALLAHRAALQERLPELATYTLMTLGVLALVGLGGYHEFPASAAGWAQTRYLLPLLPLLGAVFALAARGAGRRFGPAAGGGMILLFLAHDIFGQMQTIARYYG